MEPVETIHYKNHHTIEIYYDENSENPRTEWDNLTEIHCRSSRYYLGENAHQDSDAIDEVVRQAEKQNDMVLKLFAYIHGGVSLSLESFYGKLPQGHAEFDSGCCGVIIIRREKMLKEFGCKKWTKSLKQKAYDIAASEIKTFQAYLNGEVYGFVVDDDQESCWGFYDIEDAISEAKGSVDWIVKQKTKDHCAKVKQWIIHKVPLEYRTALC